MAFRFFVLLILTLGISHCTPKSDVGFLRISTPGEGIFEIYRIASETPLQSVSEQVGKFNEVLSLAPGAYLVMADCSSETVIIYPNELKVLTAHQISFVPPRDPTAEDSFKIQCNRFERTRSRQNISGRYQLFIFSGMRDLLVGMVPLQINLTTGDKQKPQVRSYDLAGLRVAAIETHGPSLPYFVSPAEGLVSVTEAQEFGRWQFLLPGKYILELNGTKNDIELAAKDEKTIEPGFLRISSPDNLDLELSSQIRGSPFSVEINKGHTLSLNETYPVLPSMIEINLNESNQPFVEEMHAAESLEIKARSVLVDSACSPWEWACLGDLEVFLYHSNEPYPFLSGVADVPILFAEKSDIWLSVEGSRDIRYRLQENLREQQLKLGFLRVIPKPIARSGLLTDLVRVEAIQAGMAGHTLDLPLDRPSIVPLTGGSYNLVQYVTTANLDQDRRRTAISIVVEAGSNRDIELPVYVTEKRLAALEKHREDDDVGSGRRSRTKIGRKRKNSAALPLRFD